MLAVAFIKLPRMNVFMTFGATHRRRGELNAFKVRNTISSTMAFRTGNGLVRTFQRELRTRVIKLQQARPRGNLMAISALECFALCRPIGELIAMRMLVALSATEFGEVKFTLGGNRFVRPRLMARQTRDGDVRSHQLEAALLVPAEGESRWDKPVNIVAIRALPRVGALGELPIVGVLVAIRAGAERDLVERLLALRLMALFAFHIGMLAHKGVGRQRVIVQRECCRREAVLVVTRSAIAAGLSIVELAAVGVFVALRAFGKLDGLLEIGACMALRTTEPNVLAHERKVGLRMIEAGCPSYNVPPRIDVATRAGLSEHAAMRIFVARLAFSEAGARILDVAVGLQVALRALQTRVPACDRKLRRLVIELRDRREVVETMTALTVQSELAPVFVLVACCARCPQAQEGSRSVLNLRLAQFVDVDELDLVTVPALLLSMRSRQGIPRLGMIKPSLAVWPVDELKVTADMVPVTGRAVAPALA